VIQIIGGKDKHLPIDSLCAGLLARAKAVLCIGSTASMLAESLKDGRNIHSCGDLRAAVAEARRIAVAGDVILLSPGYPSYDQFVNFEARGQLFADLARQA
jgi:UDP-N-acetylmuramoylalanine--D-glutamate ligase